MYRAMPSPAGEPEWPDRNRDIPSTGGPSRIRPPSVGTRPQRPDHSGRSFGGRAGKRRRVSVSASEGRHSELLKRILYGHL
ncbi:hypothetical protein EVAR_65936_1 [Eumeta japonica]|uniref:Uncharacterized protein n=1 Tax=Eumeta variegata TaxID=151549 RepID=A0A4C2AG42_EUMVA|nr:hypothetical protein EVAR_65936_1 [Eumeta japonica]